MEEVNRDDAAEADTIIRFVPFAPPAESERPVPPGDRGLATAEDASRAGGRSGAAPAAAAHASSSATAAPAYQRYSNPRFGFTTTYPTSFVEQPADPTSEGREWLAASDGNVSLRAYAWNNAKGVTAEQERAWFQQTMQVTDVRLDGNVLTVSGLVDNGSTIVYIHELVGPGSIYRLRWSYPASQKALWDGAVTTTAHAFAPGDASVQH